MDFALQLHKHVLEKIIENIRFLSVKKYLEGFNNSLTKNYTPRIALYAIYAFASQNIVEVNVG